jgi:peptidoglycan hydrolase-like protein with peptidoglycan-binding domain
MAVPGTSESRNIETLKEVEPDPGRGRRRWWVPIFMIALVGGGVAIWYALQGGQAESSGTTVTEPLDFAEVVITDLAETSEYEGTLGRLAGDPVSVRAEGTVTALPEEGATLELGDVVAWVDNRPVVLLYGSLPMWRDLSEGIEGPDVLQLETALTDLGYNESGSAMTVDETYSSATEAVVESWQEDIGAEDDGTVGVGEIVFASGPVNVDTLQVAVGDQISGVTDMFSTAGDEVEVSFGLPTFEEGNVEVGDPVEITLPDLSTTAGVVTEIATVATLPEDGGDPTFETVIALDDPTAAGEIDDAPVTIAVITDRVEQVTAVPVEALVALTEGGYAVEKEDGAETKLVAVEPGFFADGLVEVTGELTVGDRVVVP